MRVDKYLWCIRVFKSRSLASKHCKAGKVFLKDEPLKSSKEIQINDIIDVRKGAIRFSYKVLDFPKNRVGAKLVELYTINVTSSAELEKIEIIKLSNKFERDRGMGRPTKRDRRKINKFKDGD